MQNECDRPIAYGRETSAFVQAATAIVWPSGMCRQLLLIALIFVITQKIWTRWKYDVHKIPSPPGLPFLGHTLQLPERSKNGSRWFRIRHQKLGSPKIMKVWFLNKIWVFVTDLEFVKSVIHHKTDPFPRHPMMNALVKPVICHEGVKDVLLATNRKAYAHQIRKAYSLGFQTSQMRKQFPKLKNVMNQMIDIVESKRIQGPVDFQKLCVEFTLDSIGIVAFDKNLGGLDGSREIYKGIMDTGRRGREFMFNPLVGIYAKLFPNSEIARDTVRITNKLCEEWDKLTKEILERPDPPEGETPIWYNLKKTTDPETNEPLPYATLRSEVATVVFAGMDTTGHQLSWILGMIATRPEVQQKLLDELEENQLCGPKCRDVALEELGSLPYLNAVIKEGFRLAHIMTGGIPRILHKDMTVLGYRLPKDTVVIFPSNRCLRSEMDWGDPNVVRPERWLTAEDMTSKYFMMFGWGARDCIGQKLAMLEIRLAIVVLLSKYHISTDKSFEYLLENTLDGGFIECTLGMCLEVHPRQFHEEED